MTLSKSAVLKVCESRNSKPAKRVSNKLQSFSHNPKIDYSKHILRPLMSALFIIAGVRVLINCKLSKSITYISDAIGARELNSAKIVYYYSNDPILYDKPFFKSDTLKL